MTSSPNSVFRRLALAALLLFVLPVAHAADWLLAAPEPRIVPGKPFEVVVIGKPDATGWPARLPAVIALPNNGPRLQVELTAAGQYGDDPTRQRYLGQWPAEVLGFATLSLPDAASARLLVEAAAPADPGAEPSLEARIVSAVEAVTSPDKTPALTEAEATGSATAADNALIAPATAADDTVAPQALGFHEPMYLIYGGTHPRSVRYQLSFRYRIFDKQGFIGKLPVIGGLYFAYTQMALWDVESESKPFRDTNFRPSVYLQWKASDPVIGDSFTVAGGYEHESNGRDGPDSRSIDTWFARADLRYYLTDKRTYIGIEPKVWSYIDKEDNRDIQKYRGYGQLGLRIGRDDALMFTMLFRRGTAGHNTYQYDLSYPVRKSIFSGIGTFVHLQYFKGYGQTMLEYNQRRDGQFRAGISLVR